MNIELRIDKWLWSVRVFKTRADAAEACRNGAVTVNGNDAKPGRDVRVKDVVTVRQGILTRTLEVVGIPRSRVAAKELPGLLADLTPPEEYEKVRQARAEQIAIRERGAGRPTKRDRRETDRLDSGSDPSRGW